MTDGSGLTDTPLFRGRPRIPRFPHQSVMLLPLTTRGPYEV